VVHLSKAAKRARDADPIDESLQDKDVNMLKFFATNSDHEFLLTQDMDIKCLTGQLFEKKKNEEEVAPEEDEEGEKKAKVK